jgi:hypothetical protein
MKLPENLSLSLCVLALVIVVVTSPKHDNYIVAIGDASAQDHEWSYTQGPSVPTDPCASRSIFRQDNGDLYLCWETDLHWHLLVAAHGDSITCGQGDRCIGGGNR